jgi:hypothetical protein
MDDVEPDLRVMGVKRWKTRASESYGKEKKRPYRGEVKAKIKRTYCSNRSRSRNLFF